MIELITIGTLSLSAFAILYIQNRSNQNKSDDLITELRTELDSCRDINAKASLIEKTNTELKSNMSVLEGHIDQLKDSLTNKEVQIANITKDSESYLEKYSNSTKQLEELILEIENLKKTIDNNNEELQQVNRALAEAKYKLAQNNISHVNESERLTSKIIRLNDEISILKDEIEAYKIKLETTVESNNEYISLNATLNANIEAAEKNHQQLKEAFNEQTKKFELKVGEIMQQALDLKLKKFDESSMKSLDETLKPFKEDLAQFRKKVEDGQESSIKKFAELSKEIEHVTKAGMNITKEAQSLAEALKGKKQTQGSWGEMILETVLEYSGLLKGVHFDTQQSFKDESGDIKRPDVVIKLPQNRSIIIDSKVSLNDYDRYIRAESDEERLISIKGVAKAFKDQIDNLASKDYAHYKIGTLQYVFMFVPIEGAFSLAVQEDPTLYEYALKKHIAIVNPSTLTVSLRTIYLYWQSEQSSSLATKLFDEAGKLYDKMHTFTETFAKVGSQLQTVNKTYEHAAKQLSEGRGNILAKTENLKKLGARTSKSLNDSKIEYQDFSADDVEVEFIEEDLLIEN